MYSAKVEYWTGSSNYELSNIYKPYVNIVEKQKDIINIRFVDGYISRSDLLMIENRVSEAEIQFSSTEEQYLISMQQLQMLMGHLPTKIPYDLESIFTNINTPYITNYDSIIERIPEYKKAIKDIELQERNAKLNISALNPNITFSMTGGWGTGTLNIDGNTSFYSQATLNFSMPIFHWGERCYISSSNKAQILMMEYQKSEIKDQLIINLANYITSIEKSAQRIIIAQKSLNIANENLELSTYSYNQGQIGRASCRERV